MTPERRSMTKAKGTLRSAARIQSPRAEESTLPSASRSSRKAKKATSPASAELPQATTETTLLESLAPRRPFTRKPTKGKSGIKKRYFSMELRCSIQGGDDSCSLSRLPLQHVNLACVGGSPLPIDCQENREAYGRLRGCHGQDHDHEDLRATGIWRILG